MKRYPIEITETLQTVIYMEAENAREAEEMVREQYRDADIILDADNSNVDVEFKYAEWAEGL